jgi:hypothetical protein
MKTQARSTHRQDDLFGSGLLCALLLLCLTIAPLHALPNIKSNASLGNWYDFLRSMNLHNDPQPHQVVVFFDTDRLVAGKWRGDRGSLIGRSSVLAGGGFDKSRRDVRRENVGRLVSQTGGPDIVVYDFDEIYTIGPDGKSLPSQIVIFGRRPAAVVADGQISNWPSSNPGNRLQISAFNSCDPDNPAVKSPATARGGPGQAFYWEDAFGKRWVDQVGAGSGGYGSPGADGIGGAQVAELAGISPGRGGRAKFSWNILRPGSAGGDVIERWSRGRRFRGGAAGGAVWIKSGGRLDLNGMYARGGGGDNLNLRWTGGGSGGHVIIDSPEVPRLTYLYVDGGGVFPPQIGGVGVVEFRGTPKMPEFPNSGSINGGMKGIPPVPIGLPRGARLSQREPQIFGNFKEVVRPRVPAPALTALAPRSLTNARKFAVEAQATAKNVPAVMRYRVRPPGATFFGRWSSDTLPGATQRKSWQKEITARNKEGLWQVEVVAEDTQGVRSTGRVLDVLVDQSKPTVSLDPRSVKATSQPGGYSVEAFVGDRSHNQYAVSSGPARVEYRLRRPRATKFGRWIRFALGDKTQYPSWPSARVQVPVSLNPTIAGDWLVEMRAVDLAGNVGDVRSFAIKQ